LHTDYSLLDGAIKIGPLAKRAAELKMSAVAITDHGNLHGALSFYNKVKAEGVKPIIGIEAYYARGSRKEKGPTNLEPGEKATNHLVLLAKNLTGYQNLIKLTSLSYTEGYWRKPRIDRELLSQHSEGLIGLSACISGVPPSLLLRDKFDDAARAALEFEEILGKGNYYLEIQEHGLDAQRRIRRPLLELSQKTGIPIVATNDSHYLNATDVKAHDALLCIGTGKLLSDPNRLSYGAPTFYYRSAEEMWSVFGEEPDLLLRTLEIAEKCNLEFPKPTDHLPLYPVPDGFTIESYFEKVAWDGFEERYRSVWQPLESSGSLRSSIAQYKERLAHEIATIKKMGFPGYFLIVWDFINYAKKNAIPVGPGRGCLAGDVPIVMDNGTTKSIAQVEIGDRVRSHTGIARTVTALHRYEVNEELVCLKSYYGDSIGVTLTADHKVLAERGLRPEGWDRWEPSTQFARRRWKEPSGNLAWIPAGDLMPGDWVFVPTPQVEITPSEIIDLASLCHPSWSYVASDYIEEIRPANRAFAYSLHDVYRQTGVSRNCLRHIVKNPALAKANSGHNRAVDRVTDYVGPQFASLDAWRNWVSAQSQVKTRLARFIQPDRRFFRVLGRWIADGWLRADNDRVFGLCFHSDDEAGMAEAIEFFDSLGLRPEIRKAHGRKLTQIVVRSRAFVSYWRTIFPHYRSTPETKHIPDFVLRLPEDDVLDVLAGYWNGDGCVGNSQQSKYTATTISRKLADQVRFLGWRCGIPSSVRKDVRHDERFETKPSYCIVMAKDERLAERLKAFPLAKQYCWRAVGGGVLLRIRDVEPVTGVKEVFDLTVEEDHTYLTSSFAVHNSAAGSLVAYCMKITDVDPIQYDLLFERFLNPERISMPDIDVDFCVRGRGDVINYVSDLYGRQNVSQIITFGTMASRAVIKDVGRVMGMEIREVEKVAKMIPPPVRGRNVSIEDAIEQNPDLKQAINTNEQVAELIETARKLEGNARHSSVHAAGVVISPKPIHELIPVCTGQNGELVTQFVMSDLEKTGMLKMDFLALTTLTIIEDCLRTIEQEMGHRPDLEHIPLDDPKTLKLFVDGNLQAIFQFESDGMVEICRKLKPEGLEDLSALNALYRPGPLDGGMVDDYIERRHGRRKVTYIAPQMKETLENTLGIIIYQEQIMQLAQRLAGYSLGEADLMRRAMGKKKKDEMAVHEEKFVKGAVERGIAQEKAEKIFSLMAQFADYGFNRSHSFAYAYLAYQTAYLKAHYPTHFYAAVLSNELANTAKVARYIGEMKTFGIELLPPDVNSSNEGFTPVGNAIRFGLAAIKGIGASAVQLILRAREEGGAFKSVFDFAERVDQKAVNKRVLESLVKAGAFDTTSPNRAALMTVLDRVAEHGARVQRDRESGQTGLFAMFGDAGAAPTAEPALPNVPAWSKKESLAREKEALGFYASGHPLEDYADSIKAMTRIDSGNIAEATHGDTVAMGGLVIELSTRTTKKGDRFALFRLEDQFGSVKVVCWPEQFNRYKSLLQEDDALLVRGKLELSAEGEATIVTQEIQPLESARSNAARGILVRVRENAVKPGSFVSLCDLLSKHPGTAVVYFEVDMIDGLTARLRPQQFLRVKVSPELMRQIEELDKDWNVEMMMGD
jgi:DNA polymerase III alpha subunit